jgi:hypothetical protein
VDVAAAPTLPSVPRKFCEPERSVDEPAPAARLGNADHDPFTGKRDRAPDEIVDVPVAANDPIQDDPVVRIRRRGDCIADLERRGLGESGRVGSLASEVDARGREVDPRQT